MACATLKRSLELDPLHSPVRPSKRRRYLGGSLGSGGGNMRNGNGSVRSESSYSPFGEVTPKISTDLISNNIREEIRRLHRRKQLHFGTISPSALSPTSSPPPSEGDASSSSLSQTSSPQGKDNNDKPLFTFHQVGLICERMLREREASLKEKYENVLAAKLAEQYDTFVKFTYDQIQKRFEAASAPSYLS